LIALAFLVNSPKSAHAQFDPFTIMSVVQTAGTLVSGGSDVSATAEALSELYSEVDSEAKISDGGQKVIDRIHEIEEIAGELGYTSDQISGLTESGRNEHQRLDSQIRSVTNAIRSGKRIAKHFMKLDKKAQVAQIESSTIAEQQLAAQMELVYLGQAQAMDGILSDLKEKKNKTDQIKMIRKKLFKAGARYFAKTKTLEFPNNRGIVDGAIKTVKVIQPILIGFLLLAIALRILYNQSNFTGFNPIWVIKDAVFCALFIFFIPNLVTLITISCGALTDGISQAMGYGHGTPKIDSNGLNAPISGPWPGALDLMFDWVFHWVVYAAYLIADTASSLTQSFLVIVMPITVFLGVMFKMPVLWTGSIMGFVFCSLWQFFWNAFGMLGDSIWQTDAEPLKTAICGIAITALQLASPFFVVSLIKGASAHGTAASMAKSAFSAASSAASSGAGVDRGLKAMGGGNSTSSQPVQAGSAVKAPGAGGTQRAAAAKPASTSGPTSRRAFIASFPKVAMAKAASMVPGLRRAMNPSNQVKEQS